MLVETIDVDLELVSQRIVVARLGRGSRGATLDRTIALGLALFVAGCDESQRDEENKEDQGGRDLAHGSSPGEGDGQVRDTGAE